MELVNLGSRIMNTYLVEAGGKRLLIDTGYPGGADRFFRKLNGHAIKPEEIDYVVLTHVHDDHAGFLNEVLLATGAQLILHEAGVRRLQLGHNEWIGGPSGTLAALFTRGMALFGKGAHRFPPVQVPGDAIVWDGSGQPLEEAGLPVKLLYLPGHTADHLGLLVEGKHLFCGDGAMNGFPSRYRQIIWIENLEDYRRSWERMVELDCDLVYPAHGKPFPGEDLVQYREELGKIKIRQIEQR